MRAFRASAVGASLLLVALGVLGFVPGVTRHLGSLGVAGRGSGALLFGHLQVSVTVNLLRGASGVAGLRLARTDEGARVFLTGAGIAYLGLWLLGPLRLAQWLPTNTADNELHFAVGLCLLGLGAVPGHRARPA